MTRFDDLAAFAAVVREGSFTRAAAKQGVSQSALSQTIRALERRLDLKLLNRTTRSVSTTEAGERLFVVVDQRFEDIEAELDVLGTSRGTPAAKVRITATEHAARTLVWPRLSAWLPRYPDIAIELDSANRFIDIVAERFDIGVRLGADVAKDMIAMRIAPDMRMTVVGSPAYLKAHGTPLRPADLAAHECSRSAPADAWRATALGVPASRQDGHDACRGQVRLQRERPGRRRGRTVTTHVAGKYVFNASDLVVGAAVGGLGLAWLPSDLVEPHVARRRLVPVLDDWATSFPGYHLYYASRNASPAVSLVVGALRTSATTR